MGPDGDSLEMDAITAHLDRGWDLLQRGDLVAARVSAHQILQLEAESAPAHTLLGAVAAAEGDLDEASESSFRTLFPVTFALMCLVLGCFVRSLRAVVAIQACVGVTVVCTLGLLSLFGKSLNMVLVTLPACLSVVGTAYALHIVTRFLGVDPEAPEDPRAAWVHAARETALERFVAAVPTDVDAMLLLAQIAFERNDLLRARDVLARVTRTHPDDGRVTDLRAVLVGPEPATVDA
jgi:predicted RND superfamily exporter protein